MRIHFYAKLDEILNDFESILKSIKGADDELFITTENKRSFRDLEKIKVVDNNLIVVISSLNSLGLNDSDIANQLSWFINNSVNLVICNIPSTYEYGVSQPMNQAILSTLLQSLLNQNKNIINVSVKRSNSGRNKLPFPDNWDDLYQKWTNKEISSKDFIELSGLKKATFYNLLSEYKNILKSNEIYIKKFKVV